MSILTGKESCHQTEKIKLRLPSVIRCQAAETRTSVRAKLVCNIFLTLLTCELLFLDVHLFCYTIFNRNGAEKISWQKILTGAKQKSKCITTKRILNWRRENQFGGTASNRLKNKNYATNSFNLRFSLRSLFCFARDSRSMLVHWFRSAVSIFLEYGCRLQRAGDGN